MSTGTINRYTNLASLISILRNKELTLLDPSKWEDKNDAYYLLKYAEKKKFKSLYALCFTIASETSHHWKVFAPGADGVCIRINTERFLSYLDGIPEIVHGKVEYKLLEDVETQKIKTTHLPFLKRNAFRDEQEYRVIFRDENEYKKKTHAIPFDASLIERVVFSNALPNDLKTPIVQLLKTIDECKKLEIYRTTLNENLRWKRAGDRAT